MKNIYLPPKTKKRFIFLTVLLLLATVSLRAQVNILNESMLTPQSYSAFTAVSVSGAQGWTFSDLYGAVCSGYSGGQSYANEDWLISPGMDLANIDNPVLTFQHARGSASVLNVGVAQGWYKAFATASYIGNPSTTQWIELEGIDHNMPGAWNYIPSGELAIPDAAKSAATRIAFRYISSAGQSATWEIKNVKVTGQPANMSVFKITNWNTEWLGCATFGPTDEGLQVSNVAEAMILMDSDIYCIQEVSNTSSSPSISQLVNTMGSDQWGGAIVPSDTGDCNQRQGIIYKKSKVQLVSSVQLSSGNSAQGNSYYYNWSGGRYPSVYNVNLVTGNTLTPVTLVNIHAKAEDGNPESYTRRKGGSEALKTILDGAAYNTKNIILIGDYNDYLTGTTSIACNCSDSPYKNFMTDGADYIGITASVTDVNTTWGQHPVIENIIVSNELSDNYIGSSVEQETTVVQAIDDYYSTTSNHLPISAMFQFETLDNPEYTEKQLTVYPNPVKDKLYIAEGPVASVTVTDITGKTIAYLSGVSGIDFSGVQRGIYLLKIESYNGQQSSMKIIKE